MPGSLPRLLLERGAMPGDAHQPNPLDALLERLADVDDPIVSAWAAGLLESEEAGAQEQIDTNPTPAA